MVEAGFLSGVLRNLIREYTDVPVFIATTPSPPSVNRFIMLRHVRTDRSQLTSEFFFRSIFSVFWYSRDEGIDRGFLSFLEDASPYSQFRPVMSPDNRVVACRVQLNTEGSVDFDSTIGFYTRFYEIQIEVVL